MRNTLGLGVVLFLLSGCSGMDSAAQAPMSEGRATGSESGPTTGSGGSMAIDSGTGAGDLSGGVDLPGAPSDGAGGSLASGGVNSGGSAGAAGAAGTAGAAPVPEAPPLEPEPTPEPVPNVQRALTAGTWDDGANFAFFSAYLKRLGDAQLVGLPFDLTTVSAAHLTLPKVTAKKTLDVAIVLDTTGSMGDEIRYLAAELGTITSTVQSRHPGAQQRWSVVNYRDVGDKYLTEVLPLTDGVETVRARLAETTADGGGDVPEASEAGLGAASGLDWRSSDSNARIVFWVTDASHHPENAPALEQSVRGLAAAGVHVYPVAASGVDELAEASMRTIAVYTGGRYLFLTDDSGIGNSHKEPTIPCYYVTTLKAAMVRMIDVELKGAYSAPSAQEILRTGGNPNAGSCKLASGTQVRAY